MGRKVSACTPHGPCHRGGVVPSPKGRKWRNRARNGLNFDQNTTIQFQGFPTDWSADSTLRAPTDPRMGFGAPYVPLSRFGPSTSRLGPPCARHRRTGIRNRIECNPPPPPPCRLTLLVVSTREWTQTMHGPVGLPLAMHFGPVWAVLGPTCAAPRLRRRNGCALGYPGLNHNSKATSHPRLSLIFAPYRDLNTRPKPSFGPSPPVASKHAFFGCVSSPFYYMFPQTPLNGAVTCCSKVPRGHSEYFEPFRPHLEWGGDLAVVWRTDGLFRAIFFCQTPF